MRTGVAGGVVVATHGVVVVVTLTGVAGGVVVVTSTGVAGRDVAVAVRPRTNVSAVRSRNKRLRVASKLLSIMA
jgi:hypothetical protein